jgi:hypothetical protein
MGPHIQEIIRLSTPENIISWIVIESALIILWGTTGTELVASLAAIGVMIVGPAGFLLMVVLPTTVMLKSHRQLKADGVIAARFGSGTVH